MAIETFDWCPRVGAQGTTTMRVLRAQFGDGYAQVGADGINNNVQSWPLTFTGKRPDIEPIKAFLDAHAGYKSFYWTPPMGVQGLYRAGSYSLAAQGAEIFSITVTFEQAFAP